MTNPYILKLVKQQNDRENALNKLVEVCHELQMMQDKTKRLEYVRKSLIIKAAENGASQYEIADRALISRTRVKQILDSKPDLQIELEKYQQELMEAAKLAKPPE